jgi:hypothetical protein
MDPHADTDIAIRVKLQKLSNPLVIVMMYEKYPDSMIYFF